MIVPPPPPNPSPARHCVAGALRHGAPHGTPSYYETQSDAFGCNSPSLPHLLPPPTSYSYSSPLCHSVPRLLVHWIVLLQSPETVGGATRHLPTHAPCPLSRCRPRARAAGKQSACATPSRGTPIPDTSCPAPPPCASTATVPKTQAKQWFNAHPVLRGRFRTARAQRGHSAGTARAQRQLLR